MATKYPRFNLLLKVLILISCLLFLAFKLNTSKSDLLNLYTLFKIAMVDGYIVLFIILILMPLNWSFEAWKWQLLANKVVKLNFWNALKGVISGLGLSFFTPYGIGDYFGRIGLITHSDRRRLVGPLLMCRLVQLLITLLFGLFGIFYLFGIAYFSYLLLSISVFLILLFFAYRKAGRKWRPKFEEGVKVYFGLIKAFDQRELLTVFAISFWRYLTFGFQFLLALHLFLPYVKPHLKLHSLLVLPDHKRS